MNVRQDKSGGGLPITRIETISAGTIDLLRVGYAGLNPQDCHQWMLESGDILFSHINSAELVGKCAVYRGVPEKLVHGMNLLCLRPNRSLLDSNYAQWLIRSAGFRGRLSNFINKAVNQASVSIGNLITISVTVPPLEEQRRIAAILDKADALRQKRRLALQKLDSLTQSIFLDMFGDPVANELSFPIVPVSSFVSHFETGKSIATNEDEKVDSPFRVLKVSAVTSNDYRPEESKPIPGSYLPPESHFVKSGDLLFSRANTTDLVGATAYVARAEKNRLLPDKIWRFIWRDVTKIEPLFVWFLFRQPSIRRAIGQLATGTSGSMKNISQEKVMRIRVGLPSLEKQKRFAGAVSLWMQSREKMCRSKMMLDENFSSLQHRAFRGVL
jgi:type I restriction enzyme S subunit